VVPFIQLLQWCGLLIHCKAADSVGVLVRIQSRSTVPFKPDEAYPWKKGSLFQKRVEYLEPGDDFMCVNLTGPQCPDSRAKITLRVSLKVFLEEISIYIGRL
jgi:hypothetical protein